MRLRGLSTTPRRRVMAIEYAAVSLAVVVIVILAAWFLTAEIGSGLSSG